MPDRVVSRESNPSIARTAPRKWGAWRTAVNLFLINAWRGAAGFAMTFAEAGGARMSQTVWPAITPEIAESLFALAFGFAVAGAGASAYRLVWRHFPSFRLLEVGPAPARFAAIPVLVFTAPFIIMRNTLRGRRIDGRPPIFVMAATVIAGLWSLMSGTVVVMALEALINV
jgi:hypothetical protein